MRQCHLWQCGVWRTAAFTLHRAAPPPRWVMWQGTWNSVKVMRPLAYSICVQRHTYSVQCSDKIWFPQLCIKCGVAKSCPDTHTGLQAPVFKHPPGSCSSSIFPSVCIALSPDRITGIGTTCAICVHYDWDLATYTHQWTQSDCLTISCEY